MLACLSAALARPGGELRVASHRSLDRHEGYYLAEVEGPDRRRERVLIYLAPAGEPRYVDVLSGAYSRLQEGGDPEKSPTAALLAANGLSSRARRWCQEAGLQYLDLASNSYLISLPPLYAERDAGLARSGRGRGPGPLFGGARGEAIRVLLCEPRARWKQTRLARRSGLSVATINAVVRRLEAEGFAERHGRGPQQEFTLLREGELLQAWAEHWTGVYRARHRYYVRYAELEALAGRLQGAASQLHRGVSRAGQQQLLEALPSARPAWMTRRGLKLLPRMAPLALSGLPGAALLDDYVRFTVVEAYVSVDPARLGSRAGLTAVDEGANVVLLEPPDPGVLLNTITAAGLPVVCLPQLYADLVAAGGRAEAEAAPRLRRAMLGPTPV